MPIQNANRFTITDEEFSQFCARHQQQKTLVPESNAVMKSSYVSFYLCPRLLSFSISFSMFSWINYTSPSAPPPFITSPPVPIPFPY